MICTMTTNTLMDTPDNERGNCFITGCRPSSNSLPERRKTSRPLARTKRVRKHSDDEKLKTQSWVEVVGTQNLPLSLPLILDVPVRVNNAGLTEIPTDNNSPTEQNEPNSEVHVLTNQPSFDKPVIITSPEIILPSDDEGEITNMTEHEGICPCCGISGSDTEGTDDNQNTRPISPADIDLIATAKHKRGFVLTELLETEKKYVTDITILVKEFMEEVSKASLPTSLKGREKVVFGNIRAILNFHRDKFLPELEASYQNPQEIGELFTKYEKQLRLYVTYCENKPRSEYLVTEYQSTFQKLASKLNLKMQISDYLIKPVQRIMKYQLLLKDILKYTEKSHEPTMTLHKAMDVMHRVPKAANNMMEVGRLQGFDAKIAQHGTVLMQGTLPVAVFNIAKPTIRKFKPRRLFLFEQIFVISDMCESPSKGHYYKFRTSIKLRDMRLVSKVFDEENCFILSDTGKPKIDTYIRAPSLEVKEEWTREIQSMLDKQTDFLQVLADPMSHCRLSPPPSRTSRVASDRPETSNDSCIHKKYGSKDKNVRQNRTIH